MRTRALLACTFAAMLVAGAALAADMALDQNGDLYRIGTEQDGLYLARSGSDGITNVLQIPQTTGIDASHLAVAVDSESGAVFTLWQEHVDARMSRIVLAALVKGTWAGPITIAGDDGVRASNPVMLAYRAHTQLEDGTVISTGFLHLAWWADELAPNGGHGMYAVLHLDDIGLPVFDELAPEPLRGALPFGFRCPDLHDSTRALAHPKLFVDSDTGDPHVIFADIQECLFTIRRLHTELEGVDPNDEVASDQRRRHIVVLHADDSNISIHPDLQLANASFEVGHALSVVLFWDQDKAIRYIRLDRNGWSEPRVLPLDQGLSHEAAVSLIRGVAN